MFFSFVPFGRFRILYIFDVMKPNKENIITDILLMLENGKSFDNCAGEIDMIWGVGKNTFTRYWKEANERFKAMHAEIQENYKNVLKDSIEERQKRGIMTKIERMEVLTSIANGTLNYHKEVVTKMGVATILAIPDYNDRKGAIAELNKMDGDYAPTKKDITSNGKEIKAITGIEVK